MVTDTSEYIPEQGDIIVINFDPSSGREIKKKRPAIVISTKNYCAVTGLVAVCPITSTKRDYFIKLDDEVNPQVTGYINALQLKTLDFRVRDARFVEKATTHELGRTAQVVKMIFNFSDLLGE